MIKLKDVAEIIDSLHATPKYSSNGYPMVRVMDVNNSFLHLEKCCKVDEQTCNKHNKNHIPQKGDIIITRVGSYGMLAYIDTSEKFCLGQNIAIISPRINGKYLYYYLQSPYLKNIIYGKIGGSSYKCIGLEDIKNLPYESFNLNCDRIGEILYKIDSKIEINNAISAQLQSLAKLIYDYWFLQFEFPNEEGKPYKSSGGKMIWNEDLKRDIPEGWEASKLCKMFDIIMGSSPKGESLNENYDGIEFYQGSTDFGNLYPIQRVYTTAPVRLAKAQDVLITKTSHTDTVC